MVWIPREGRIVSLNTRSYTRCVELAGKQGSSDYRAGVSGRSIQTEGVVLHVVRPWPRRKERGTDDVNLFSCFFLCVLALQIAHETVAIANSENMNGRHSHASSCQRENCFGLIAFSYDMISFQKRETALLCRYWVGDFPWISNGGSPWRPAHTKRNTHKAHIPDKEIPISYWKVFFFSSLLFVCSIRQKRRSSSVLGLLKMKNVCTSFFPGTKLEDVLLP